MKKYNLLFLIFFAVLISCQNSSPKLIPQVYSEISSEKLDLEKEGVVTQLDVLFVIDDSASMREHQRNLANNIDLFTQEFTKSNFVDYHVGVITTSYDVCMNSVACRAKLVDTAGVSWVERSTPNGSDALRKNLLVGVGGSGTEMFFKPIISALSKPLIDNENKGFYRERAHLAIVILTDTEDQSSGVSAQQTFNFLKQLKVSEKNLSVYAAYIDEANLDNCNRDNELTGRLDEFFKLTKAVTFSLCDKQFGKRLVELGRDLFRRVATTMYLTRRPQVNTIRVYYGNIELPRDLKKGWWYDAGKNAIIFGDSIDWESQPKGSKLSVQYDPE